MEVAKTVFEKSSKHYRKSETVPQQDCTGECRKLYSQYLNETNRDIPMQTNVVDFHLLFTKNSQKIFGSSNSLHQRI